MERRQNDVQLGYLTGKMEEMAATIITIAVKLDKLEDKVTEKFTTVETVIRIGKYAVAIVGALLTLKFGDLAPLWKALTGG